jgi:hypothetical protein
MLSLIITGTVATIIAILAIFPFSRYGVIRPLDEGFYSYPAWLINRGKHPYKDFYFGYTPAKAYFLALLFKIFGEKLNVARIYYCTISVLLTVEIFLLSYLIALNFILAFSMAMLFLISLFPRREMYYPIPVEIGMFSDRTVLALASMISLIIGWQSGLSSLYLSSGLLLGITFLWGQEAGIWTAVSSLLFLLIHFKSIGSSQWGMFFMGMLLPIITAFIYAIRKRIPLKRVWNECIKDILILKSKNVRRGYPSLFPSLPERWDLSGIIDFYRNRFEYFIHYSRYYLPVVIYIAASAVGLFKYWYGQIGNLEEILPLLLVYGVFSFIFLYSWPDYSHIARGFPIQLPITAYVIDGLYENFMAFYQEGDLFTNIVTAGSAYFIILFLSMILYDLFHSVRTLCIEWKQRKKKIYLDGKGGIYLELERHKIISNLIEFIRSNTKPDEKLLVLPADPLIYFLSERESPTYLKSFFPHNPIRLYERAYRDIKGDPVKWIIYNRRQDEPDFFPNGIKFSEYASDLYQHILRDYRNVREIEAYDIYASDP